MRRPLANPSPPRGPRRNAGTLSAVALLLFVISRWFILSGLVPIGSDIDVRYYPYASRAVDLGDVPYAGSFQIEYPPVAWWVIRGVRELSGPRLPPGASDLAVAESRDRYTSTFRLVMCGADVVSFVLFAALVVRRRPAALGVLLLAYTLATAALGHLLYDRLDVGVLLLLLAWAYAWTRDRPRGDADQETSIAWTIASYGAVGLGVAYKIIPMLALPFLLVADWRGPGRARRLLTAALTLVATIALPVAAQYHASGPGTLGFLAYQSERGIEIGSLFASVMAIVSLWGPSIAIVLSHGGTDLAGTLAQPMKTTSTIALAGLVGGLLWWTIARLGRYTRTAAYQRACFAVAAAVILSPVLSPQYFIWALPLVLLLAADLTGRDGRALMVVASLVVVIAILTSWVFPYHFYYTGPATPYALVPIGVHLSLAPSPWPFIVLAARNVTYLALLVWLGTRMSRYHV